MNDNQSPALRAALDAVADLPPSLADVSPWSRFYDRLLYLRFIDWLREDVRKEGLHDEP